MCSMGSMAVTLLQAPVLVPFLDATDSSLFSYTLSCQALKAESSATNSSALQHEVSCPYPAEQHSSIECHKTLSMMTQGAQTPGPLPADDEAAMTWLQTLNVVDPHHIEECEALFEAYFMQVALC